MDITRFFRSRSQSRRRGIRSSPNCRRVSRLAKRAREASAGRLRRWSTSRVTRVGVATLMSAFESLNGVPATANRHLLDDILRREWKFSGFVVSDWEAVKELINHGVAGSEEEAA